MKHKELISKLTLEEKASLTSGKDFWQTMNIPHQNIPSLFLSDGPHGLRKQAEASDHLGLNVSLPATCFPTSATLANSFNIDLLRKVGHALGEEVLSQKVNVLLGPGVNIKRSPRCGRNFEYFSEDPYLAGKMAANYINGVQENGVASCIKHYACNNQEERRLTSDSVLDERTFREIYLTQFEIAIEEAQPKVIMSSYNLINGVYANENSHLLKDILRDEFKFKGIVVTDWGGNNDRVEALVAGNELEMPGNAGQTDEDIIKAIKDGKLDEKVLDESVDNILTLIDETTAPYKEGKEYTFDVEEHHKIAKQAAVESIVLLKNKDNVLPLNDEEKVAFIGDFCKNPRYQGAGSSIVNPTKLDNTLEVVKDYPINFVGYEQGFNRYGKKDKGAAKKAIELAKKADKIVYFMGLDEVTEAEGLDRENISINQNQIDLLKELKKTGKKIIVVISAGSSVDLRFDKDADAVLLNCLNGQAGAGATLEILIGQESPSGKLSESYPLCYEDTPTVNYFPAHNFNSLYKDAIFVGYRYFDKVNKPVKYPFGYGLSYTTFEYSDLKVDEKGVSFKLTNTGNVKGKEVAQLYVGLNESKIFRAKKELKGFVKVELEPGETKEVEIPFDKYSFRFFNVKNNAWEVEKGNYSIYIGASSQDIRLEGELFVDGVELQDAPYDKEKLPSYFSGEITNVSDEEFLELYGRSIPEDNIQWIRKNRIVIHYNTTVQELRYARGWTGRAFAGVIRFAINLLKAFGKKNSANVLIMGVVNQPMRGLSRMTNGAISWAQLDALLFMFNGHFHKGIHRFFKAGRQKPKINKTNIYSEKNKKGKK
ncbi:MAG: glycoside hydrolase family 3 C-terminal domain-containing protein [Bacilli bacterium]|nr:glycoside hydrolase family 3 C-terminal domain-containing protein [Bacilli bacterium]